MSSPSDLSSMRLTIRQILGMAPGLFFIKSVLMIMLAGQPTLQGITWLVCRAVNNAWTAQVIMMLWVGFSSISQNIGMPWHLNVCVALDTVQAVIDKQCNILANVNTQADNMFLHYHAVFYPYWYIVLPIVSYMCFSASYSFYVVYYCSGSHWNIVVQLCFIVMLACYSVTTGMLARLIFVYHTKNLHHVQLEVDWMIFQMIYWGCHVLSLYTPDQVTEREWVWNEITWPRIQADMTQNRHEITMLNIEYNTVASLPPMPSIFHQAPASQQPGPLQPVLRRSARLSSPRRVL